MSTLAERNKSRVWTDEQRKKISERVTGEGNPFAGQHHTEETRERMSEIKKNALPGKLKKYGITHEQYLENRAKHLAWCWKHRDWLPESEFYVLPGMCKECSKSYVRDHRKARTPEQKKARREKNAEKEDLATRASRLKHKYGVTPEWYYAKLAEQGGVCALCSRPPLANRKYLCVDHDHQNGPARGLLCSACNMAIGLLELFPSWEFRAIAYLEKYKEKQNVNESSSIAASA